MKPVSCDVRKDDSLQFDLHFAFIPLVDCSQKSRLNSGDLPLIYTTKHLKRAETFRINVCIIRTVSLQPTRRICSLELIIYRNEMNKFQLI